MKFDEAAQILCGYCKSEVHFCKLKYKHEGPCESDHAQRFTQEFFTRLCNANFIKVTTIGELQSIRDFLEHELRRWIYNKGLVQ